MIINEDDRNALAHYGILRKSGRYPWGSGDTPYERAGSFLGAVKELRDQNVPDTIIAKGFGMTTSELRDNITLANQEQKAADIARARRLKEKGLSNVAIGKVMKKPESTIRNYLKDDAQRKTEILKATTEMLRDQVAKKKYVDIGKGVELHLGISAEKLRTAYKVLEEEGYRIHYPDVEQLGTGKTTKLKVLCAPETTFKEVWDNRDKIVPAQLKSDDGGKTYRPRVLPPISISSKRVKIRYAEEGGTDADGVIYVRPGVKDVELGKSNYAQVRIAVDGTHYLKGMAVYREEDMPDGVDLVFNTNKSDTGNKLDAMKKMGDDPEDPFGANISNQLTEIAPDGTSRVTSVMNIVNERGDWDKWSKNLSSQMLSKQKPVLAKEQLDLAYEGKELEFQRIMGLNNPRVKKYMLEKFADSADASAVHLKAAALPRQATKVILPVNSLRDDEVYAPSFRDGEKVVLVRFPHGGIFEIPELRVNNRHREARKLLGTDAPDAIGINSRVAERLSGADFDGDTVLVIPNNRGKIRTEPPLKELRGFDPKAAYPAYEGMPRMTAKQKGREMGDVSNLITDMTIMGAPFSEIAQAVRHSMVVIDAEKHNLNYKQSAIDNGIANLKRKYQGGANRGAATIVSKATAETRIDDRKLRPAKDGGPIDPRTGRLVYVKTGAEYYNGKPKKQKVAKLAVEDDAHELVSDLRVPIEVIYANHSNRLKALANKARRELLGIESLEWSSSAAKAYAQEVKTLNAALNEALRNAPLERQAQLLGNAVFRQKKEANPDLDPAELKKLRNKALQDARDRVGAGKKLIEITPRQWEAIQAGAISNSKLDQILDNTDVDKVKELATPKDKPAMTSSMRARAEVMIGKNYTLAEVADHLGISLSTLKAGLAKAGDES